MPANTLHQGGMSVIYHENLSASVAPAEHERALRAGASHSYQFAFTNRGAHTDDVAETVRAGSHGARPSEARHAAYGVRRLTPRECERLMGFPDDWTAGQSDSARYRQLGNAVAVPVAEWIARRIVAVESEAA